MSPTRAGIALREWLRTERRTQQWLAAQLSGRLTEKVHQTTVSRWIRGEKPPTVPEGIAIQDVTGVPLSGWGERAESETEAHR